MTGVVTEREVFAFPMSYAEERLWLFEQIYRGTPTYNLAFVSRIRGPLDVDTFLRALEEIVARHETLRTSFGVVDGQPSQLVESEVELDVPLVEAAGPDPEQWAREYATREAREPFDLGRAPLLRARLVRLAEDDHVFVLVLHHIVSDAWSLRVLLGELSRLYGAFRAGEDSPLGELEIQYGDYASWQRSWLGEGALEDEVAYWRERLRDLEPLALSLDRPRSGEPTFRAARHAEKLPAEVREALETFARGERASAFMVVSAALKALLSRWTGQHDIALGTAVAGRNDAQLEPLIGFFVNMLVLRTDVSGDPTFRELVGREREVAFGAYAHQDVPFQVLVDELAPHRDLSSTPFFQVAIAYQDVPSRPGGLDGLELDVFSIEPVAAPFDLTVSVWVHGEGFRIDFLSKADLLGSKTIARLGAQFRRLLAAAVTAPDTRLSELPLLDDDERRQVVDEWNDTDVPLPAGGVAGLFAEQAARHPDAVAVVSGTRRLRYDELDARADALARRLREAGAGGETVVGVCVDRSIELVVALLAVVKAGAAYLPLDPAYPRERLAFMLEDSGARVLLTHEPVLGRLPPHPVTLLVEDESQTASAELPAGPPPPASLAYVMYTSGSTGRPKGVAVPQTAVIRLVRGANFVGLGGDDVLALLAPVSFDASTLELWGALLNGARLVVPPPGPLSVRELGELVEANGVTVLWLTAGLFHEAVDHGLDRFHSLRWLLAGGDVLSAPHVARARRELPGCRLVNGYGPTENTTFSACHLVAEQPPDRPVALGRPISNSRAYVVDDRLAPVPVGVPGEIVVGGLGVARGYVARAALTAARFVPDPFAGGGSRLYRTGDRGRWRSDGTLEFLGRIDAQMKVRGFRIEPGEVEAALTACAEVREAVAVVRGDAAHTKELVAYVVPADGAGVSADDLRAQLGRVVPEYMLPSSFVALPALPLTPNGKVDRDALPAPSRTRAATGSFVPPRTSLEQLLAELWAEVLGRERVGVDDDFFELGGHSLQATRLVTRVEQALGVALPLRAVFERPTVAALARAVEAAPGAALAPPVVRHERGELSPPSFGQQRLWLLQRLDPTSAAYNVPLSARFRGSLDVGALERAVRALVARHEVLRTAFVAVEGEPMQRIAAEVDVPFELVSAEGADDPEAEARRLALEDGARPFDLEQAPLVRVRVVRLATNDRVLLLTAHHIVCDGWSMPIVFAEIGELYAAEVERRAPRLPELPVQYADYAVWQRDWAAAGGLDAQLAYWEERLRDARPLELPSDRPRPAMQSMRGAHFTLELSPEETEALRRLAREHGATLFMVLLAGFKAVLSRYCGTGDVVVGAPVAGRSRSELEPLIGFFVNTLALRTRLDDGPSFRELLARVREVVLGGLSHQDVPFEQVVKRAQPERDLSRMPLVPIMFALQTELAAAPELGGLRLEPFGVEHRTSKFDLFVAFWDRGEKLVADFEYSVDLFGREEIARFAESLATLLAAAAADAERRVDELPVLTAAARTQVLETWNRGDVPVPEETLASLFEAQVRRAPGAFAVVGADDRRLTYAELDALAERVENRLRALGVGREDVVAVCARRTPELVAALLGVLKSGAAYLPLDRAYPPERVRLMLDDSRAVALVTDERSRDALPTHAQTVLLEQLAGDSAVDGPPASAPVPGSLAYLIYTSGSTGVPKGVAITHRNAVAFLAWARTVFGDDELRSVLASTSVCFDLAIFELFAPLTSGGCVVLVEDANALLDEPPPADVALLNTVPSALRELVRARRLPETVRTVNVAGEPLPLALVREVAALVPEARIYNLYGPSEDTTYSTFALVDPSDDRNPPIGRTIANSFAYVLDARMQPVPVGVPGELYLGGDGVARGYFGRPRLTAERFVPDPFTAGGRRLYRTGDLVCWRDDGVLEFRGRLDDQLKVRGFRIEPGEIEAALRQHPQVGEAVVVAHDDDVAGRRLVAYVVGADGAAPPAEQLRLHLASRLPEYMVPAIFLALPELPLTPNRKVDRAALPAPAAPRRGPDDFRPPRTDEERLLAELLAELLSVDRVGVDDNFFDLGGDSLLAARAVAKVRDALDAELPLRTFFQRPTVAALAAALQKGEEQPPPATVAPRRRGELVVASAAQQRLWLLQRLDPATAAFNLSTGIRLRGPLDLDALARALDALAERHEAFRTGIVEARGEPIQRIVTSASLPLELADVAGAVDPLAEAQRLALESVARPFDLERPPLVRALAIRLGDDDVVLALTAHQLVFDGWSIPIAFADLARLYLACRDGADPGLPPLSTQYADYALWERDSHSPEALEAELAHWEARLRDAPVLELPGDRDRPPFPSLRGGHHWFELSPQLVADARRFGRAHDATLFMVLLAAFQVVAGRHGDSDDVLVGSVVSGRTRPEFEWVVGPFVNTIPLRTSLAGDPPFAELVGRVREVVVDALSRPQVRFEHVIRRLQRERDGSRMPLVPMMVALESELVGPGSGRTTTFDGLEVQTFRLSPPTSRFDLAVCMRIEAGALVGDLEYSADLYDEATAVRLADDFARVTESAAANPRLRLSELSASEPSGDAGETVRRGRFRIPLRRIESELLAQPDVSAASVAARDGRLVAHVEPADRPPDPHELRARLARTLPAYMVPAAVVVRGAPAAEGHAAPSTEVEQALAAEWKAVLGVADVRLDDDFFELGGDSLLAARALAACRERLGVDLPLRLFLTSPTVRTQAALVEDVRGVLTRFGL